MIKDNLNIIKEKIETSAAKTKISKPARLLAVTKGVSHLKIAEAIEAGQRLFGENYLQESNTKMQELSCYKDIEWHFIGGLQSNKAKKCLGKFSMIQTIDRESLATELNKQALKRDIKDYPILVELNLADETTKSGISQDDLIILIEKISLMKGIKIKGLMSMPPWCENSEDSRKYFIKLREIKEYIQSRKISHVDMDELSMGMSHDYEIAVEEGATIVRVGTSLFGERL